MPTWSPDDLTHPPGPLLPRLDAVDRVQAASVGSMRHQMQQRRGGRRDFNAVDSLTAHKNAADDELRVTAAGKTPCG